MSQATLQVSKTIELHRPAKEITLPDAPTWPLDAVMALFELPFNELMFHAQETHRAHGPSAIKGAKPAVIPKPAWKN